MDEDPPPDLVLRVRKFVAEMRGVPVEEITLDTPVFPAETNPQSRPSAAPLLDLSADSLDLVEFVMAMEEEFDRALPDAVAESLTPDVLSRWTVRDLVHLLAGLQ